MQTSKLTSVSSAVEDAVALLSIALYVTMNRDHWFRVHLCCKYGDGLEATGAKHFLSLL